MDKFSTSVYLDEELCKGCINCIKRCPTEAIRVRNGKAEIKKEFCIDCGECIRICPYHAKRARYDSIDRLKEYKYTIALPAPSLYGQFNNLEDVNIVLTALKKIGFDDVYEVSGAAELVSQISREYISKQQENIPYISTACPCVIRLIRVRFPNLIPNLLPIIAPVDLAANLARQKAMEETGLDRKDIGIFFITPCPAKVSAVRFPLGIHESNIDCVLAMKDIYPLLLSQMKEVEEKDEVENLSISGKIGISWGGTGGEASGLLVDSYLAADGIENVIRVLEDLEDKKFDALEFIELNACSGGCVGGVLTVENPFVAKVKLKKLRKYLPVACSRVENVENLNPYWTESVDYEPVFKLGNSIADNLAKISRLEELNYRFPGLDCGSCGAPTCSALAEDIVRGIASEKDCIHILRQFIHRLSNEIQTLDNHNEKG